MEAVSDFFCQVWAGGPEVVPFDLGLAVLHVGAYCAAAYDGEQMVSAPSDLHRTLSANNGTCGFQWSLVAIDPLVWFTGTFDLQDALGRNIVER